jgi:GNAT superfamily N-acetyltransferase
MAALGGHPIATDPEPWADMELEFRGHEGAPDCIHLLAETVAREPAPVGWAYARTTEHHPLFEPARVLHVHALYVSPPYRRQGVGRALLEAILEWGRSTGCSTAELNVLTGNPARSLYGKLGFEAFEIEMTRKL